MIDLTKELPQAITVNGDSFKLRTDYRLWIRFGIDFEEYQRNQEADTDVSYVFENEAPIITVDVLNALLCFYYNPPITPKAERSTGPKAFDYLLDGDYIFSALYAVYGIDIAEIEMHWHKFQALVLNISGDSTMFGYIKQARLYKKSNDTYEKCMLKAKDAYALPVAEKQIDSKEIDEFNAYFGGGNE
ncbi:Gp15 family bacteriophage protein [Amedibacillus sp. YH-ame6]